MYEVIKTVLGLGLLKFHPPEISSSSLDLNTIR